jgi:hypothetical protein
VPYLLFNRALSGSVWPNTFYAKQAEYAILLKAPLPSRLAAVGILPFIGAQALLLPGVLAAVWGALRTRHWELLLAAGWGLVFAGAYALRLPVTYQHWRYLIPTIPIWIALGAGGVFTLLHLSAESWLPRVISRAWRRPSRCWPSRFGGRAPSPISTMCSLSKAKWLLPPVGSTPTRPPAR